MSITRIYAIVLRQVYLLSATPTRLIQLMWGSVDIILWGFISVYLTNVAGSELHFAATILGAMLLWEFFMRVMYGITTAFLEDVWSRNFLNLFGSPLKISEYLSGLVLTGIITIVLSFGLMVIVAALCFGFSIFSYGAALLPSLLILFLFGIAFSIFAIAIILRFGPAAEWFTWPLPAVIAPFVGVFYPLATLPHWMQLIGHAIPASYVFENARSVVFSGVLSVSDTIIGTFLALLYIAVAYALFAYVYRQAIRTGHIARYSAESAT